MAAPHPYRIPELDAAPRPCESGDALRSAQSLARVFLLGWSLLRVAVCSVRGLDLEGCAALAVVVAMASSLGTTWSRFS